MDCDGGIRSGRVPVEPDVDKHMGTTGTSKSTEQLLNIYRSQSLKRKVVPAEKIHEYVKMRRKLLQRLEKLEQREVSFENDSKELFYINSERKIKKSILGIEKLLYNSGALIELDEDLLAFYSNKSEAELMVLDTGNELLTQRLTELIAKKANPMLNTPSFDELSSVMREVRQQQGSLSNIPDPELDSGAFLDRLENVAFMIARNHQKFISAQFLDRLDLYVPRIERQLCSTPPDIGSDLRQHLTAETATCNLSDDVFRMEMRAAGRVEQENPDAISCGEEIDITNESVFDISEDEDEDEEDDEEESYKESADFEEGSKSMPSIFYKLHDTLTVDAANDGKKVVKRGSESLEDVMNKKVATDVRLESCGSKGVGEDLSSMSKLGCDRGAIVTASIPSGNAKVCDIAEREYIRVISSKSECQGSQTSFQGCHFENKDCVTTNEQGSDIVDIIYID